MRSPSKYTYSQSREIAEKTSTEVDATYGNTYGIKDFVIAPFGVGLTFKATANFSGGYKGKYETSNGVVTKNGIVTERESRKTTRFQVNGHWQSAYIDRKLVGERHRQQPRGRLQQDPGPALPAGEQGPGPGEVQRPPMSSRCACAATGASWPIACCRVRTSRRTST